MRTVPTAAIASLLGLTLASGAAAFVVPLHSSSPHRAHCAGSLAAVQQEEDGAVLGQKYLLSTDNEWEQSTSGKSTLVEAMPHQGYADMLGQTQPSSSSSSLEGQAQGQVLVKFSDNIEALEREMENYSRVTNEETKDLFVTIHDFYNPSAAENQASSTDQHHQQQQQQQHALKGQAALVMEQGSQDLKEYLEANGPLRGDDLRMAVATTARIVKAIHAQKMVWTELKSTNFVVQRVPSQASSSSPSSSLSFKVGSPVRNSIRTNSLHP